MNKYVAGLVLSAVLSLWFVFGQEPEDPYEKGLRILREHGAMAGIEYFREMAIEENSAKSLYHLAWSWWSAGNHDEARRITEFLQQKVAPDNIIAGHCHYLMSYLNSAQGKDQVAFGDLEQALKVYRSLDKKRSTYRTLFSMAFIQIRLKNHEEAERLLDQGVGFVHQFEEQTGKHANLGFYHELRSRLAFKKGRYQEALEASLASIEEYELDGDAFRATQAKSGAAYFMILTGRVEEGLTLTKEVDDVIFRADGLEQLSFYNAINWLQGYRCKGKPYDDLEKQLKNRIASHKDQFLKEHLEFALKWDCGRIE